MTTRPPKILHEEVYQGIKFKIVKTFIGINGMLEGQEHLKYLSGRHFNRYFIDQELAFPMTPEIMRTAIDRMIDNRVCYTEDLRERVDEIPRKVVVQSEVKIMKKFSAQEISVLKREAKVLRRTNGLTHSQALDQIAKREGWTNWALLHKNSFSSGQEEKSIEVK